MFLGKKQLISVLMLGLFLTACGEEDSGSKDTKNIDQAPEQIATDVSRVELTNSVVY